MMGDAEKLLKLADIQERMTERIGADWSDCPPELTRRIAAEHQALAAEVERLKGLESVLMDLRFGQSQLQARLETWKPLGNLNNMQDELKAVEALKSRVLALEEAIAFIEHGEWLSFNDKEELYCVFDNSEASGFRMTADCTPENCIWTQIQAALTPTLAETYPRCIACHKILEDCGCSGYQGSYKERDPNVR